MKKTHNIVTVILACFTILLIQSCSDSDKDNGYIYNGDGVRIYGFQNPSTRFSHFEDKGVVEDKVPVILIGGADGTSNDKDVVLNYIVDTENSTATEGVEFDFKDTSGKLIIPAGSDYALFPLNLNTGNFNASKATKLILKLVSTDTPETTISDLNRVVEISFIGCRSTLADSQYNVVVVRDDGSTKDHGTESLTSPGVNTFVTETTGLYNKGQYSATQGFTFVDICGSITVEKQGLFNGQYSNQVYTVEPGKVDENGNFVITYAITFDGKPTFFTATYTKI